MMPACTQVSPVTCFSLEEIFTVNCPPLSGSRLSTINCQQIIRGAL